MHITKYYHYLGSVFALFFFTACGSSTTQQLSTTSDAATYQAVDTQMLKAPKQAPSHSAMTYTKAQEPTYMESTVSSYTEDQDAMRIEENKKYGKQ